MLPNNLIYLLIIYQLKHFFADYPLQTPWMLGKFKDRGWVKPLAAHCGVHAGFTLAIALAFNPAAWWVCFVDFAMHFWMDRVKASPKLLGQFEALSKREFTAWLRLGQVYDKFNDSDIANMPIPCISPESGRIRDAEFRSNRLFWYSLGIDQMVHHLTHYFCIWEILTHV